MFYAALARTCGGLAGEPACGAGRILAAAYASGVEVWGADPSEPMLALAGARLAAVREADPRLHALPYRLEPQTLQKLAPPRPCGLLMLPLDAFRLLRDGAEQLAFLARARAAVTPRGRLALDLTLPAQPPEELPFGAALTSPDGTLVRTRTRWRIEGDDLVEETEFELTPPGGAATVEVCRDRYRNVAAAELDGLLRTTGWSTEARYADFWGTPFGAGAGRLVLVARPRG
ncbi:MAG: hypothetical protein HYU66_27745 [Armatimonadetes bacterium]|nr:hypothetical protein [Armatimonadota bacterium]